MLNSMFNLARSTSRVCDIADRNFFTSLSLLKNLSEDATVVGIIKNILKIIHTFGNNSHKPGHKHRWRNRGLHGPRPPHFFLGGLTPLFNLEFCLNNLSHAVSIGSNVKVNRLMKKFCRILPIFSH